MGSLFTLPRHGRQVGATWSLPAHVRLRVSGLPARGALSPWAIFPVWRVLVFIGTRFRVSLRLWARDSTLGPSGRRYTLVLRHLQGQPQLCGGSGPSTRCLEKGLGVPAGRSGSRDWVCGFSVQGAGRPARGPEVGVGEQAAARAGLSPGRRPVLQGWARCSPAQVPREAPQSSLHGRNSPHGSEGRRAGAGARAPDGRKVISVSLLVMALMPSWGLRLMAYCL